MRDRCRRRFRDLSNVFVLDETWDQHLNAAYHEFYQAARWPFRMVSAEKTLAAGTKHVDLLISEIEFLSDVYDETQDRALVPKPDIGKNPDQLPMRTELFLQHQDSEPIFYEIVGLQLFIFPAPKTTSHTIKIWYLQEDPDELVNDTDVPVLPLRYHDALVSGAVSKAFLDDGNIDSAVGYKQEFNAILQQAYRELKPKGVLQMDMDSRFAKLAAMRGPQAPADQTGAVQGGNY